MHHPPQLARFLRKKSAELQESKLSRVSLVSQTLLCQGIFCATRSPRRQKLGIVQIESIQDLIVVITRRRFGVTCKRLRVRAFKKQNRRVQRRELRVQARVVKRIIRV